MLVRLLGLRRSLVVQVAVTTLALALGIVGWMRHVPNAPFELGAAISSRSCWRGIPVREATFAATRRS